MISLSVTIQFLFNNLERANCKDDDSIVTSEKDTIRILEDNLREGMKLLGVKKIAKPSSDNSTIIKGIYINMRIYYFKEFVR